MSQQPSRFARLLRAYRCADPHAARLGFRRWYGGVLGQALLAAEREQLDGVLHNLFGYHLLQVGVPTVADLAQVSRVSHCMVLDDCLGADSTSERHCVYGEATALPIASSSIDVLLLPHTLELESEPHQVLREAERTLIPEGHVVILGFNPWSFWGLLRLLTGWRRQSPWCGRFFTSSRIKDWLALLGFDIVVSRSYFFRPPVEHAGILNRLGFMERAGRRWWPVLGGGYILVARKRVTCVTPIRQRWRSPRARLLPGRATPAGLRRQDP